jgi:hypothetical protein
VVHVYEHVFVYFLFDVYIQGQVRSKTNPFFLDLIGFQVRRVGARGGPPQCVHSVLVGHLPHCRARVGGRSDLGVDRHYL